MELQANLKVLVERIADAINKAKAGRIIADSEELVRDAHATFRQEAYQKAIDLVAQQTAQEELSKYMLYLMGLQLHIPIYYYYQNNNYQEL